MSSTEEDYVLIFSYTKLFLLDLRPNNKVVFSRIVQDTLGKSEKSVRSIGITKANARKSNKRQNIGIY